MAALLDICKNHKEPVPWILNYNFDSLLSNVG